MKKKRKNEIIYTNNSKNAKEINKNEQINFNKNK